jgi:hypothetical protein
MPPPRQGTTKLRRFDLAFGSISGELHFAEFLNARKPILHVLRLKQGNAKRCVPNVDHSTHQSLQRPLRAFTASMKVSPIRNPSRFVNGLMSGRAFGSMVTRVVSSKSSIHF